ncbi:hypothetical protein K492DRAFT_196788 [Lichtheimia hyalospora FSU 10163]|nr:hypothetical protein K492DRAFT_196788 [Lichtheimia hyalospora FSU 10163]
MIEIEFKRPKDFGEFQKLIFQKLAEEHPDTDVADIPSQLGIRAMPTFLFYKDGQKHDEILGANVRKLEEAIKSLTQLA